MTSDTWTELPLHEVLNKWASKNKVLPAPILSAALYVGLVILTWITIKWLMRFVRRTIRRTSRFIWKFKLPFILVAVAFELPLSEVLYRWTAKNTSLPVEMVTTTFYVAILVTVWFTLMWIVRFARFMIMRIIWPFILFSIAVVIFGSLLKLIEREKIHDLVQRL